jgi:hypothetical protein
MAIQIEFINFNEDVALNPEVKPVTLSQDSKGMPPSFCLPWVEATRYSLQIKSNQEYWIRKGEKNVEACVVIDGKPQPASHVFAPLPKEVAFLPKSEEEARGHKIDLSYSPAFSSPWQSARVHSVTLKMGICWWTPPGWGLLFASAVHRNEDFRIIEGFVRTDLWHRDIPIVVQPLRDEIRIPKYGVVASAWPVKAEDLELKVVERTPERLQEVADQTSKKRIDKGIYKKLVLPKASQ